MTYTMDLGRASIATLERLRKEGKSFLYVSRNSMYTDLGYYWVNEAAYLRERKGSSITPKRSPAGIMRIGSFYEVHDEYKPGTREGDLPIEIHEHFVGLPICSDWSVLPTGRYEIKIIEIIPSMIRAKLISNREIVMEKLEGTPDSRHI